MIWVGLESNDRGPYETWGTNNKQEKDEELLFLMYCADKPRFRLDLVRGSAGKVITDTSHSQEDPAKWTDSKWHSGAGSNSFIITISEHE